ncbi:MAG TPA: hypothetical protein PLL32_09065 [Anaeromyxobacteraceae bacterium]|nr:hypothetical protein [Anaeromyxobacteraceae bacterium]
MKTFRIGGHRVRVWWDRGRWVVAVDDATHVHWFMTEAQAAGAGLIRAQRLTWAARRRARVRPRREQARATG